VTPEVALGAQARLICVDEAAVATNPLGAVGVVGFVGGVTGTVTVCVVALAWVEGDDVPPPEMDRTMK